LDTAADWVERGLALVRPIADSLRRRLPASIETEDLVGAGRLALVKLARSYDPGRGVPFEIWAKFRIRAAMIDSIKRRPFREAKHARLDFTPAGNFPSPEDSAILSSDQQIARRALGLLSEKERAVLRLVFLDGLTLGTAAERLDLSEAEAAAAKRRALERLRRFGQRLSCGALERELSLY